jgi:hypothetical protein
VVIPDELIVPAKRLNRIKEIRPIETGFGATPQGWGTPYMPAGMMECWSIGILGIKSGRYLI